MPDGFEEDFMSPACATIPRFKLPDGRRLRMWMVAELEDASGDTRDLTEAELGELGVELEHDDGDIEEVLPPPLGPGAGP